MIQALLKDIFQYADKLSSLCQFLLASSIFLGLSLSLNVVLVLLQPNSKSILIIFALGWLLHQLLNQWRLTHNQLSMFNTTVCDDAGHPSISIAARPANSPFYSVPQKFIRQADHAATIELCQIIERYADESLVIREQKLACEKVHKKLTNHDAANLLLMALSLRDRGYEYTVK